MRNAAIADFKTEGTSTVAHDVELVYLNASELQFWRRWVNLKSAQSRDP